LRTVLVGQWWTILLRPNTINHRCLNISQRISIVTSVLLELASILSDYAIITSFHSFLKIFSHLTQSSLLGCLHASAGPMFDYTLIMDVGIYSWQFDWFRIGIASIVDHVSVEPLLNELLKTMSHECLCLFLLSDRRWWRCNSWICVWCEGGSISWRYFSSLHGDQSKFINYYKDEKHHNFYMNFAFSLPRVSWRNTIIFYFSCNLSSNSLKALDLWGL